MSADLLRQLLALDLSTEQALAVMDIIENRDGDRKEKARARWHKWNDKRLPNVSKHEPTLANVSKPTHVSASPAPDLENKQTNKQENKKERATRLPKDWTLPFAWLDEAVAAGLPASRVHTEAEKMLNWSLSDRNGAKHDWHATWRNWFQRALESLMKATGPPKPPTLATMWRDEARNLGILNDPASQPNRRVEARFASADDSMPGLARRIAGAGSG